MKILGVGTDLVEVARIDLLLKEHGDRFRARCFRPEEFPPGRTDEAATVGGRWAAKEALLKALGTDVRGVPYRDVEVLAAEGGPPGIRLHGSAEELFRNLGGAEIHLTISHERGHALAFVIITG